MREERERKRGWIKRGIRGEKEERRGKGKRREAGRGRGGGIRGRGADMWRGMAKRKGCKVR